MLLQLIVSGIAVGSVYTLVALGMTILYRSTTVVNFCHGEFFMLGAFAAVVALQVLGWGFPWAVGLSLVLLFCIGYAMQKWLLHPLMHAPFVTLAMMTVALSYLLKGISRFFYGREVIPLPAMLEGDPIFLGDAVILPQDALIIVFTGVVVVGFYLFFQHTQTGKVIHAASQGPRGAMLVGINVPRLQNVMWGVGAIVGAAAGILIAPNTLVYPDMGGHMLIRAFAAMCLGGFGSFPGAVLGGIALGLLENLVGGYIASELVEITSYIVIVLVLIIRPQGILGEWSPSRG